jgi:hypothetical protein
MKKLKRNSAKGKNIKITVTQTSKILAQILNEPIKPIIIDFKNDQINTKQPEEQQQSLQQPVKLEITSCSQTSSKESFFDLAYSVIISTFLTNDCILQPALEFDNWSPVHLDDQPLYD